VLAREKQQFPFVFSTCAQCEREMQGRRVHQARETDLGGGDQSVTLGTSVQVVALEHLLPDKHGPEGALQAAHAAHAGSQVQEVLLDATKQMRAK